MKEEDRSRLLDIVDMEILRVNTAVSLSTEGVRLAGETSDTRLDPGPVWAAQTQVQIRSTELHKWRAFRGELINAGPRDRVETGATIVVSIDDGEEEEFLVMDTNVPLPGGQVITPKTPLIRAVGGQSSKFRATFQDPQKISHKVEIREIH